MPPPDGQLGGERDKESGRLGKSYDIRGGWEGEEADSGSLLPRVVKRKEGKWADFEFIRSILPEHRVAGCSRRRISKDGDVEVRAHAKGGAYFRNLQRCGCVWVCPVCTPKVAEHQRAELVELLDAVASDPADLGVYLVTPTVRHAASDDPEKTLDGLRAARKKFWDSGMWKRCKADIGYEGSVRGLEVTFGLNGMHPHDHKLVICRRGGLDSWRSEFLRVWKAKCVAAGMAEPNAHGMDIRGGDHAAEYVGKWGMDAEMTRSSVKQGRGANSRTPFELLRAAREGDGRALRLFKLYAEIFENEKRLRWSPGLRKRFGLGRDRTDKEVAEAEGGNDSVRVGVVSLYHWKMILASPRRDARHALLRAVDRDGRAGLNQFLVDLEVAYWSRARGRHRPGPCVYSDGGRPPP